MVAIKYSKVKPQHYYGYFKIYQSKTKVESCLPLSTMVNHSKPEQYYDY